MKFTAFIFARGGSKGIPKKNIQEINGRPLISYAIKSGLQSKYINRIIVSTDCQEIAEVASHYGAETPVIRPSHLALDSSPEILAWRHAIDFTQDYFNKNILSPFISLPTTSPLRSPSDIDLAIEKYLNSAGKLDLVVGISESRRNPYLNMVTIRENNQLSIAISGAEGVRRQDVPKTYDISTSVYVASPKYIMKCNRIIEGRVGYIEIPPERAIDIDDEYDFYLAEQLLKYQFVRGKF